VLRRRKLHEGVQERDRLADAVAPLL
jgi:hypothetical protein